MQVKTASLRRQLLLWLMLPLLTLFITASGITYYIAVRFANLAYDTSLYDTARSIAQQIRANGEQVSVDLPEAARQILASDPYDKEFYKVSTRKGRFITGVEEIPDPPPAVHGTGEVIYYDAILNGQKIRVAAFFVNIGDAGVEIEAAETRIKRDRLTQQILLALSLPQIVLILLAGALTWGGVSRGLAPLRQVAEAIGRRSHRDLSMIPDAGIPGEVRPITHAINGLLERLELSVVAYQRFIADAAHQLRTPLAGINMQIERALREKDMEGLRLALQQLQTSSKGAARLVNQLLTLARAEPGADAALQFQRVDLAALARRTCANWVPQALGRRMDLGFAGCETPLMIDGDELLLTEMLGNLIDNAVRYGRDGGTITVRLEGGPTPTLSVDDDGPGIALDARARAFERFYRVPGSPGTGCGLGLAIVREIAHAHGAEVSLEQGQGGSGTLFKIIFSGVGGLRRAAGSR